jgi:hypothetical protein
MFISNIILSYSHNLLPFFFWKMNDYSRMSRSFKLEAEPEKKNSFSVEGADASQIKGIASSLRKFCCDQFIFGERLVFGRRDLVDGFNNDGGLFYTWPPGKVHTLSRDPHPDLQERFPVPDDKVCWLTCPDEEFDSYKPEFASEADKDEALKLVLEKRKPEPFSSLKNTVQRLNSNKILDVRDLSVELQSTSCRPSHVGRNPCGRYTLQSTIRSPACFLTNDAQDWIEGKRHLCELGRESFVRSRHHPGRPVYRRPHPGPRLHVRRKPGRLVPPRRHPSVSRG